MVCGSGRLQPERNDSIHLWDVPSWTEQSVFKMRAARSVSITPNGRILAIGGEGFLVLRDRKTGKELGQLSKEDERIDEVSFTSDGKHLVSGGFDNLNVGWRYRLWDVDSGKQKGRVLKAASAHGRVVSPDGSTLGLGNWFGQIELWDIQKDSVPVCVRLHEDGVGSLVVGLHGKLIVSGSRDKTVKVWNAEEVWRAGTKSSR